MKVIDQFRNDILEAIELASGGRDSDVSDFEHMLEEFARDPSLKVYNSIFDSMASRGVSLRLRSEVDQKWRPHLLMPHVEITKHLKQISSPSQRVEVDKKPVTPKSVDAVPVKPAKPAMVKLQAATPARVPANGAMRDITFPLRTYYEEIDLLSRTFLYRELAPADPNERGISDYRMNDLKAFFNIMRKARVSLAIGHRGFHIEDGWIRSMERSLLDDLQQVVVTDLSQPGDDAWRSGIEGMKRSFSDDRTAGVLILKYGDEFMGQNVEAAANRIDESFIQSIRSHFLLHPNPSRHVVITGTSAGYSGDTAGHMLIPLLRRLCTGTDAPINGMALNLRKLNHRQVAEIIWGIGYDQRPGYNSSAVKYVIGVLEHHLPLLPTFIKHVRDDALKHVNSIGYEDRIAIRGSRLSHPRPTSRKLLTITTRSDRVPEWYKSRLDNQAAIYGGFAYAPRAPHTIFNVSIMASPLTATIAKPSPML